MADRSDPARVAIRNTIQFGTAVDEGAAGIGRDGEGRLYVVGGAFLDPERSVEDAFIRAFDGQGHELWRRELDGEGSC